MIKIRTISSSEVNFINAKYQSIGFKTSNPEKEYIIIAEYDGHPAGQGRLVFLNESEAELGGIFVYPEFRKLGIAEKIVGHLVQEGSRFERLYCLPFEHLSTFYKSFGFRETNNEVHKEIREKLEWCLRSYEVRTLLLELFKR